MNVSATALLRMAMGLAIVAVWAPVLGRSRGSAMGAIVVTIVFVALLLLHARWLKRSALGVIRTQPFPAFLKRKLMAAHPQLDDAAARRVERGLRQFFGASAQADGRFVAMPSKVVDTLWHEFILHTRGYEAFCRKAFGRLLHHTPAEAMSPGPSRGLSPGGDGERRAGLRRAWYWSCKDEGIDPRKPDRLPTLFALDTSLAIAGGYAYALDCSSLGPDRSGTYCAGELGCGSSCGSSDGGGHGGSDSSDAGSGDGGGGDGGGGGCGGGD